MIETDKGKIIDYKLGDVTGDGINMKFILCLVLLINV